MNRVFISGMVLFWSLNAIAKDNDCSPIDLRSEGESMAGISPTSQGFGRTNLCGFYSASTMIDAWREAHSKSKISPIVLGVEHAIERNIPIWFPLQHSTDALSNAGGRAGSMVCAVINGARKIGGCADPDLKSADFITSAHSADKAVAIYKILQEYGVKSKAKRKKLLKSVTDQVLNAYQTMAPIASIRGFSHEEMKMLIDFNARKPYETIRALLYSSCDLSENRVELSELPSCQTGTRMERVDQELDRDRPLPVSFAYCARIHKDGPGILKGRLIPKNCGMHWSVVIGRKEINGQCHYLVRNSYHPEYPLHSAFIRDGMDFWMDRETLRKSSLLFQWLEQ